MTIVKKTGFCVALCIVFLNIHSMEKKLYSPLGGFLNRGYAYAPNLENNEGQSKKPVVESLVALNNKASLSATFSVLTKKIDGVCRLLSKGDIDISKLYKPSQYTDEYLVQEYLDNGLKIDAGYITFKITLDTDGTINFNRLHDNKIKLHEEVLTKLKKMPIACAKKLLDNDGCKSNLCVYGIDQAGEAYLLARAGILNGVTYYLTPDRNDIQKNETLFNQIKGNTTVQKEFFVLPKHYLWLPLKTIKTKNDSLKFDASAHNLSNVLEQYTDGATSTFIEEFMSPKIPVQDLNNDERTFLRVSRSEDRFKDNILVLHVVPSKDKNNKREIWGKYIDKKILTDGMFNAEKTDIDHVYTTTQSKVMACTMIATVLKDMKDSYLIKYTCDAFLDTIKEESLKKIMYHHDSLKIENMIEKKPNNPVTLIEQEEKLHSPNKLNASVFGFLGNTNNNVKPSENPTQVKGILSWLGF